MKKIIYSLLFIVFTFNINQINAQEIPKWKLADLQAAIKNAEKPTIFNFWATFCKPCIEELPHFQQLVKKYDTAGVRLILVSMDMSESYPSKLKSFAAKREITFPIKFLDETNADLFCPAVDKNWSGVIPASLFINHKTGYYKFFEEALSKEQLEKEIKAMIVQ
jgi:thiol-disulfide isomerase/thioredoxin